MPADRHLIEAIAAAAERAVPPCESQILEGWRLRHAGAGIRRADSVMPARFDASTDLKAAIDAVEAWYRERSVPACFQLTARAQPGTLDALLESRGYACVTPVVVMARPLGPDRRRAAAAAAATAPLRLEAGLTPMVLDVLTAGAADEAMRRAREALLARIEAPFRTALMSRGDHLVASGFCVVDGGMAGLFSIETDPAHRRLGLATRVITALCGWAHDHGARQAWLQVEEANAPALALYRRLGFEPVDRYWYRERPNAAR